MKYFRVRKIKYEINKFLEVCHDIKIRTGRGWGNDKSYKFGSCSSQQTYGPRQVITEKCCQPPGVYNLICKSYSDNGWQGGYLKIDGVKYCDNFTAGPRETVKEITFN